MSGQNGSANGQAAPIGHVRIYGRASTVKQVISPKDQAERCEAHYKAKLAQYQFGGFYIDEATTSGIPLAKRPFGAALLRDLKKGDVLVVLNFDRLFRSFGEAAHWIDAWDKQGVTVHVIVLGIDSATVAGRVMLRMFAVFAELERVLLKERTAAAMAHVKRNRKPGQPLNQNAPLGFRIEGSKGNRRLVTNEAERVIMAQIVEMHDERHMGFEQITGALLRAGVKNRGGKPWSLSGVQRAFKQEKKLRKQESHKQAGQLAATT